MPCPPYEPVVSRDNGQYYDRVKSIKVVFMHLPIQRKYHFPRLITRLGGNDTMERHEWRFYIPGSRGRDEALVKHRRQENFNTSNERLAMLLSVPSFSTIVRVRFVRIHMFLQHLDGNIQRKEILHVVSN